MATLILNRLSGLITSGPSFMLNVSVLNIVLLLNRGTLTQKASIGACTAAIIVDILISFTLAMWFIDKTWRDFTRSVVAVACLKRLYSVVPVYVTFLRYMAICGSASLKEAHARLYAGVYFVLSVITAMLHILAYTAVNWNSAQARNSNLFKVYRYANLTTTSYFIFFGVWLDIQFIRIGRCNPHIQEGIRAARLYYNVWISLAYEIIVYVLFIISIVWSTFNVDVTSSVYVEQLLLSLMMSNGTYVVTTVANRNVNSSRGTVVAPTTSRLLVERSTSERPRGETCRNEISPV
ncbi:MAG: hypothetical protein BJ554DRAFT_6999 [Olpidium bornovanus]|uniref:Uncharacterized protein n=1 Tax=Olpidium bornovanus TaxID=278681 RepID=A0A8H8DJJ7_9FUNG|nr:MAG: hypothetical protein BJ554DRAFT_6999 [Olpidium bornovanus]